MRKIMPIIVLISFACGMAGAETLSLTATENTGIKYMDSGEDAFYGDRDRGNLARIKAVLVKFDLSTLDSNTRIKSAKLLLHVNSAMNTQTKEIILSPILGLNHGWKQSQATCNFMSEDTPWKNKIGEDLPTFGITETDVDKRAFGEPISSMTVDMSTYTPAQFEPLTFTIDDLNVLQNWIMNPASNAGLMIYGNFGGAQPDIAFKEWTGNAAPTLVLEY